MKLLKVDVERFKCFDEASFDLSAENGLFLVTGKNEQNARMGANAVGKSTLFDAICFGLYGKTATGAKGKTLLNRAKGKSFSVTLLFRKIDGTSAIIKRTWGPISTTIDGNEVQQEEIDSLFGMTIEQFKYAVYFPQRGTHFIDLSPSEKLSFLSEIFQLDKWVDAANKEKEKLSGYLGAVSSAQSALTQAQASEGSLVGNLADLQELSSSWGLKQAEKIKTYQEETIAMVAAMPQIPDVKVLRETRDAAVKRYEESVAAFHAENEAIQALRVDAMVARKEAAALELKRDRANTPVVPECPTCGQKLPEKDVTSVVKSLTDEITKLKVAADLSHTEADRRQELLQQSLNKLEEKHSPGINTLNSELSRVDSIAREAMSALQIVEDRKKNLARMIKEENPNSPLLVKMTGDLQKLRDRIKQLQSSVAEADLKVARSKLLVQVYPEYRLAQLDRLTGELDMFFNQALSSMGLPEWKVEVKTSRPQKNEIVKKEMTIRFLKNDEEIDLSTMSGGEQQRVRLATALGIADLIKSGLGNPVNLMLFDEPSTALSDEGVEDMLDFFQEIARTVLIYIADHQISNVIQFTGVVNIIKGKDGNSKIKAA